MADGIPPWLNIDPLRPVQFFLQGTSTGVGAAEARNRAQAAAMELAQRAAAQQAANERAALAAQSDAAQTAARIQEIQQQRELNEQKAAMTARRYAASNSIREAIARGIPAEQAFFQNPDFFLETPGALTGLTRERQVTPTPLERNVAFLRQLNPSLTDAEAAAMVRTQIESGAGGGFAPSQVKKMLDEAEAFEKKGNMEAANVLRNYANVLSEGGGNPTLTARNARVQALHNKFRMGTLKPADYDKQLDELLTEDAKAVAAGVTAPEEGAVYPGVGNEPFVSRGGASFPVARGPEVAPAQPAPAPTTRNKAQDRQEGQRLLKQMEQYPELQKKIRARFKEFYGEDL